MSEDERDEQREEGSEPPADSGGEEQAPPPRTAAGRARQESDPAPPGGEEPQGITEEFEGLEAELSAEIGGLGDDGADATAEEAEEAEAKPDAADEQEEPPHESVFEEAGGEDDNAEDEDEDEPVAGGDAEAPPAAATEPTAKVQETIETDTLVAADREAEQEAAHAGLKARAEKSAAERVGVTGVRAALGEAAAAGPTVVGDPPKRTLWWRFVAATVVTVTAMATATALAFLLYLKDIGDDLKGDESFERAVRTSLDSVEGGDPQTILILGSDKRTTSPGDPGRSDTTMLLRVDPDKGYLALLSLPRDLKVEIPGYGSDKLNAAYSYGEQYESKQGGGPDLTLETVKDLLGIDVNHIVNIDFSGFYEAVNAIGCVYIDVDRHYYNPVGGEYDDIDIEAGYTRLCGYTALDYVRYRHNDNDIVRGARQQSFISQARQQVPPRDLLPFLPGSHGDDLIKIFTKYTTSDISDPPTIIEMLKSFVEVRDAPVRQVELDNTFATENGVSYVLATNEQIQAAVDQFLGKDIDDGTEVEPEAEPAPEKKGKKKDKKDEEGPSGPVMIDVTGTTAPFAETFRKDLERDKVKLPVFYPTAIPDKPSTAVTDESRGGFVVAVGDDPVGKDVGYRAYKFVVSFFNADGGYTAYYGLSGTNWKDPPILNNPSETREIDGRDYLLFYDSDRLRLVGWKTSKGSYWVSNTLTGALNEDEMLAVATATREFDG